MYRGGIGMYSYYLHRLTGVGILLFLAAHIVDTVLIGWGPDLYNHVMALYRHPLFRVGEVGLAACVLFHALNGLRIIVIDFYPPAVKRHAELFYWQMLVFILLFVPGAYLMIKPLFD